MSIVGYFASRYSPVLASLGTKQISTTFFTTVAVYSRNHPEFVIGDVAKAKSTPLDIKQMVDTLVGAEITNEIRDRIFANLDFLCAGVASFMGKLSHKNESLIVFYICVLYNDLFPQDLKRYLVRDLEINQVYYNKITEICNGKILRDKNKLVCSPNYGNVLLPSNSPFRVNRYLPLSLPEGVLALTDIAYKLSQPVASPAGSPSRPRLIL